MGGVNPKENGLWKTGGESVEEMASESEGMLERILCLRLGP